MALPKDALPLSKTLLAMRWAPTRCLFQISRLTRPQIRAREHAVMTKNCEPEVREHVATRMRKVRNPETRGESCWSFNPPSPELHLHCTSIQNVRFPLLGRSTSLTRPQTTCLVAPEVTEGHYYANDAFVRQDIGETRE